MLLYIIGFVSYIYIIMDFYYYLGLYKMIIIG